MPTVEARITGVEQDASTGWYRITTDDESIRRLDTKVAEKAREAAELKKSGDLALIEFSEKQGTNINPHTQRPYMNRYYEQAGSVEPETIEAPPDIPLITPTRAKTDPDEAWRICLAAGGKLAVATLPLLDKEQQDFDSQKKIASAWARFFFFSHAPKPEFADLAGAGNAADDDIPF